MLQGIGQVLTYLGVADCIQLFPSFTLVRAHKPKYLRLGGNVDVKLKVSCTFGKVEGLLRLHLFLQPPFSVTINY